jgi:hypothetical protein
MSTVLLFLRRPALFLAAVIACAIALRYAMDMVTLLCEAYVKANITTEQRKMARFKTHMNLISQGRFAYRGKI